MPDYLKQTLFNKYTGFVLGVVLVFMFFYGFISFNSEPAEMGQVIGAQTFTGTDGKEYVKYAFVGGEMDIVVSGNVEQAAGINKVKIIAEDVSQRTSSSRTFVTDKPDVRISEFISGPQYFKDDLGYWWQTEYAVASPEQFAKLPKTQLYARLTDTSKFAFIKKAFADTDTFYPDPSVEVTSVDGMVYRVTAGESFSAVRSGSGTTSDDSGTTVTIAISADSDSGTPWDAMRRGIFGFDTSSISDNNLISSATFSIDGSGRSNFYSQSVVIDRRVPATATALANDDYNIAGWDGVEQASNRITVASWSITVYNDFTLNAAGLSNVNKTGVSWLGVRLSGDFDNSEPSWLSVTDASVTGNSADQTGTTQDPKLVIVHTGPPPSGSIFNKNVIFNKDVIFR